MAVSVPTDPQMIRRIMAGVWILLMASGGAAKCPLVTIEVRGKVVNLDTKNPLTGLEVLGFFDDYSHAIGERSTQPSRAITNSRGEFVLQGSFDSFQRYSWWGHQCAGMPERIEVIVSSRDQGMQRHGFQGRELSIARARGHPIITLPTIRLDH